MSAYKWLKFAVGVPIAAILLSIVYRITNPVTDVLSVHTTSTASQTGLSWYNQALNWLPLMVLMLLAFMVIVAIITRRRRVQ